MNFVAARKDKLISIEAEHAALGAVFLDPQAWPVVAEICPSGEFFSQEKMRILYLAFRGLADAGMPTDIVTVGEKLERENQLTAVGGMAGLAKFAESVPSAENVRAYARIVADRFCRRRLVAIADEMQKSAIALDGDIEKIGAGIQDQLQQLIVPGAEDAAARAVGEYLPAALEEIDRLFQAPGSLIGAAAGYVHLDEKLGGLQRGDLVVIAARPAMGKSAFALNIAENFAGRGEHVLIFSLEMPGLHVTRRLLGGVAGIDQHRLRTGRLDDGEWPAVVAAARKVDGMPIVIDESPAITIADMRAACRRLLKDGRLDLVVVDYLQLMDSSGQTYRSLAIAEISRGLKLLAKEFDVPVLALSQLNRSLESRPNKRPLMSDLRESGAIEQDADVILFIYRDVVYHPETERPEIAEIIIAKQRNGPIGTVYLEFRNELMKFSDYQKLI